MPVVPRHFLSRLLTILLSGLIITSQAFDYGPRLCQAGRKRIKGTNVSGAVKNCIYFGYSQNECRRRVKCIRCNSHFSSFGYHADTAEEAARQCKEHRNTSYERCLHRVRCE